MKKLILAADIGGTKTLLQLSIANGKQQQCLYQQRYSSGDYAAFQPLLTQFLHDALALTNGQPICAACLAIAGPVTQRTAQVTNLLWQIDADALQKQFSITHVELVNDFAAVGYGIGSLQPSDFHIVQTGDSVAQASCAVIGAGTGLGEGYLVWQGDEYKPFPSEGGHVDFAPANDTQINLLRYLQARFGHVSYERIVSGSGLLNIYDFCCEQQSPSAALLQAMRNTEDGAATITDFALQKNDPLAQQVLDIFIACYGAQAGNLALTCLARGGVYIAGGIASRILPRMLQGDFMHAFCDKGRFAPLMKSMPVKIILNAEVGLHGANRVAFQYV